MWGRELSLKCWKALSVLSTQHFAGEAHNSSGAQITEGPRCCSLCSSRFSCVSFPSGHSFFPTSSPPRMGFQLSQQSCSALGQPSSLCTLRTLKVVQQKEHRNLFATHGSNIILIMPRHCSQTQKHHSTRQARCETQDSTVSL